MGISIVDVAEMADVSRMTVTRVMRNDSVREETKNRVLKAMQKLGYVPSRAARAMRSADPLRASQATCFAMVFGLDTQKADEYFCEITRGIERQASEFGLSALQVHWQEDSAISWQRMQTVLSIDGLCGVIMVGQFTAKEIRTIKSVNSNIILVDGPAPAGLQIADIESDNLGGSELALAHLKKCGAERTIVITGPKSHYFTKAMTQGANNYKKYFKSIKIINTDYSPDAARNSIIRLLDSKVSFDAIFANDMSCVGAIKALNSRNIRIPEDVQIIGFDDIPICEYLTPSLTSISIDKQQLGRESVKGLVAMVRNKTDKKILKQKIKAKLRKRESTN
jgi:DNA-binding LacI/PurR family transcriptional regulator